MTRTLLIFCAGLLVAGSANAGESNGLKDFGGYHDPLLFTRMPSYFLSYSNSVKEAQFDGCDFHVRQGSTEVTEHVEGHKVIYSYNFDKSLGQTMPSPLQIVRNYKNAAAALDAKILLERDDRATFRIDQKNQEVWAEVKVVNGGLSYYLTMVERDLMKQDVVANAAALERGLAQSGHVELPGIYFDVNKAELKPESRAAIDELVSLLQGTLSLKIWVVGHTDNTGAVDANLTLSRARAAAVVSALEKAGVAKARLGSFGVGPYAPVASNASDEGRARNRRVELVSQP